jgi:hypothetical protein
VCVEAAGGSSLLMQIDVLSTCSALHGGVTCTLATADGTHGLDLMAPGDPVAAAALPWQAPQLHLSLSRSLSSSYWACTLGHSRWSSCMEYSHLPAWTGPATR